MSTPKAPRSFSSRVPHYSLPLLVAGWLLGAHGCGGDSSSDGGPSDAGSEAGGSAGEPGSEGGAPSSEGGQPAATGGTPATSAGAGGEPAEATGGEAGSATTGGAADTGGEAGAETTGGTPGGGEAGATTTGGTAGGGGEAGTATTGGTAGAGGEAGSGTAGAAGEAGAGGEGGDPGGCLEDEPENGASCSDPDLGCGYPDSRQCECLGEEGDSSWGCVSTYECEPGCYNHGCAGLTDFCTADYGQCEEVPCIDDSDCCGLAACDNLTFRCEGDRSPYFFCTEDNVCQRAPVDYVGVCRDAHEVVPQDGTCDDPCPADLPTNGSRCMPLSEVCSYGGANCTCETNGDDYVWDCVFPI